MLVIVRCADTTSIDGARSVVSLRIRSCILRLLLDVGINVLAVTIEILGVACVKSIVLIHEIVVIATVLRIIEFSLEIVIAIRCLL